MVTKGVSAVLVAVSVFVVSETSEAAETGFFAGVDISAGIAGGSSDTTTGGAPFGGGGTVYNVNFGNTFGIGGHIGYRISPELSTYLSYEHISGSIKWNADFAVGLSSRFEGRADSDVIMANLAYHFPLSPATSLRTSGGVGGTFNTIKNVDEWSSSGIYGARLADATTPSLAAEIGAGIEHRISPAVLVGLTASVGYSGRFETGRSRGNGLGVVEYINAYIFNDVWRGSLGLSLTADF